MQPCCVLYNEMRSIYNLVSFAASFYISWLIFAAVWYIISLLHGIVKIVIIVIVIMIETNIFICHIILL